jgi:uncharacterized protein
MLLDLRGFRGGTEEISREFEPGALAQDGDDFRVVAPVQLTARAVKDAQKIRLTGRVRTTLETDCGRCLEPFAIPVDAPFDLMFLPEAEAARRPGGEQEMQEDDAGVAYYKDDVIDLGAVMREQFILALPMKPLCREDCQGLCPVCGINRNRERCDCRQEWIDPRLAGLKNLLND